MAQPTPTGKISTPYGKPGTVWKCGRHTGTDYVAPTGTPITAIADGSVVYAGRGGGWGASYGIHVIVQHGNARVAYAHLSELKKQNLLDKIVKEGELLGLSGSTGNSTGAHLHLEARNAPYKYDVDSFDPTTLISGPKPPAAKKTSTKPKVTK